MEKVLFQLTFILCATAGAFGCASEEVFVVPADSQYLRITLVDAHIQIIAVFVDEQAGWAAGRALLTGSIYSSLSVNDAVAKWVHGPDAHTKAELSDIDRKIRFSSSLIVNSLSASQIGILLDNMAYWEGYFKSGIDYYLKPGPIL